MSKIAKLLSLVLAIVMVLSLAVAAVDYTDIDDLTKTEKAAAEKVTLYGIMQGDGNGFQPDRTLRRDEMAKVIYITVTGKQDPGKAYAGFLGDFADGDKVADWAKNYVGYAAINGILKGDNNGNVNPAGEVTYVEAAIMLLRALGKDDDKGERYTGEKWFNNACADALDIGLFADIIDVANFKDAMPRKSIAVMTVNAFAADTGNKLKGNDAVDNAVKYNAIVIGGSKSTDGKKLYLDLKFVSTSKKDATNFPEGFKYEIADLSKVDELIGKEVTFSLDESDPAKIKVFDELTVVEGTSYTKKIKDITIGDNVILIDNGTSTPDKVLENKLSLDKIVVIRDGKCGSAFGETDKTALDALQGSKYANDEVTFVVNSKDFVTLYYNPVELRAYGNAKCDQIYDTDAKVWTDEYYLSADKSIVKSVTVNKDGKYIANKASGADAEPIEGTNWFFASEDFADLKAGDIVAVKRNYSYATDNWTIELIDGAIEEVDVFDLSIVKNKGTYTIQNGKDTLDLTRLDTTLYAEDAVLAGADVGDINADIAVVNGTGKIGTAVVDTSVLYVYNGFVLGAKTELVPTVGLDATIIKVTDWTEKYVDGEKLTTVIATDINKEAVKYVLADGDDGFEDLGYYLVEVDTGATTKVEIDGEKRDPYVLTKLNTEIAAVKIAKIEEIKSGDKVVGYKINDTKDVVIEAYTDGANEVPADDVRYECINKDLAFTLKDITVDTSKKPTKIGDTRLGEDSEALALVTITPVSEVDKTNIKYNKIQIIVYDSDEEFEDINF